MRPRSRLRPDAMWPKENCEAKARDAGYMKCLCSNIKFISTTESHPVWQLMHYSNVNFNRILYSKQRFPIREERTIHDVISMTDNKAMRTTLNEAEAKTKMGADMPAEPSGKVREFHTMRMVNAV